MKKIVFILSLFIASSLLFAFTTINKNEISPSITAETILSESKIPSGCYKGTSRRDKDFCRIIISYGTLHVCQKDGTVIARWEIVSDNDGTLSLKSEYDAHASASWWTEDGNVYLSFNYQTYVRDSD